jgi:hypothetical protein
LLAEVYKGIGRAKFFLGEYAEENAMHCCTFSIEQAEVLLIEIFWIE